jgi:predicted O-linked N-acetylglucosamine transferase (SPINDLY family)
MLERVLRSAADGLIARGNAAEKEGKLREACELYRMAARSAPDYAKAHLNLGIALDALGEAQGARAALEKALALDPAEPYANYNLGRLHFLAGALPWSERLLREALRARPEFFEARFMLACVLQARGDPAAAAAEFEAALRERPDDFAALFRHAGTLAALGRLDQAQAALRRALAVDARSADAWAALFHVLDAADDLEGAAQALERLVSLRPDWVDAHYNHGAALKRLKRPGEAEQAFRRALRLDAGHAPSWRMLGGVLMGEGRLDAALELYGEARARCPEDFALESAELFALNASERVSEDELFERHKAFGARLERAVPARFAPFRNPREPQRRLRVGYVSGEFGYHVVTLFMRPVLERHDRAAFEVFCYATGGRSDRYARELATRADHWRDAGALAPEALADAIHADGIDILVDLAGHSGVPQLALFAQQPAPVQATWLGYLNTTGMTRIGWRISDRHADPEGAERRHTESIARLPHSQWCYRPFVSIPPSPLPPSARNRHVTFGSFNQPLKLSASTRALWARILAEVGDARLVVLGVPDGRAQQELRGDLGAAAERVTTLPYLPLEDYFRAVDGVDIALDTTPYSGGTTTLDALWMGVPVLTAPGARPSSRSAASILASAGLQEWIAAGPEDYVRRAVRLSADRAGIAALRGTLRERLRSSPLMDEAGFTRDLESAYRQMWRRYCQGE